VTDQGPAAARQDGTDLELGFDRPGAPDAVLKAHDIAADGREIHDGE
jgi:hypothetical protein